MLLPITKQTAPIGTKIKNGSFVVTPRNIIAAPTAHITFGISKSCDTTISPISISLDTLVTKIPVARDIRRDGIELTNPSPIVRIVYLFKASPTGIPCITTPITIPPTKLIIVIIRPAVASPLTYFTAPSMEP